MQGSVGVRSSSVGLELIRIAITQVGPFFFREIDSDN